MDGNHLVVNKLFFVVVFSYPHGLGHDLCQMAVNGDRRVKKSEAGQVNLQHMRPFSSLFKFTFFCAGKPQGHIFSFLLTAPTYRQSTAMFMCKKSIHVKSTDLNFCVH